MKCLGIDFGTTSVKAVLFDDSLNEIATSSEEYTLNTRDNLVELDPEKYWSMLQNALNTIREKSEIHCLAVDTQCETLILTDEQGNPVRDAIVWLDNRATEEAEILHFFGKHLYAHKNKNRERLSLQTKCLCFPQK